MDKLWTVYYHKTPNGKYYFGITSNSVYRRWQNGQGYKGCSLFHRAIQKYGWDNIEHHIIVDDADEFEAKNFEECLILQYESNNPKFGYNLTNGGDGSIGWTPSEETRKKISEALKGKKVPEDRKRKISDSISGDKHWNYGKHHSEDTKLKMSQSKIGKSLGDKNPNAKAIICLDTGEVFSTMKEASEKYGINRATLSRCLNGKYEYANGLKWKFIKEGDTYGEDL